jgi:hypothetical protein
MTIFGFHDEPQVKLSQPLANGKLIDLSYFKEKSVATLVLPPPTFDINIGDAYYSLTELQGARRLNS